jgi:hypothetical protein
LVAGVRGITATGVDSSWCRKAADGAGEGGTAIPFVMSVPGETDCRYLDTKRDTEHDGISKGGTAFPQALDVTRVASLHRNSDHLSLFTHLCYIEPHTCISPSP